MHSKSLDWNSQCYAINVTAKDLTVSPTPACQISQGLIAGSVAASENLSLTVPNGKARKLEVFLYRKKSALEACPSLNGSFAGIDPGQLVRVGSVESFDTLQPTVNLDITLSLPASSDSIISQYNLPAICSKPAAAARGDAAISLGSVAMTGSGSTRNYKIQGTLRHSTQGKVLTGGSYIIELGNR